MSMAPGRVWRWCASSLLDWLMMDMLNLLDVLNVLRSRSMSFGWSWLCRMGKPWTSRFCLLLWSPHLCHLHSLIGHRLPADDRTTGHPSRCGNLLVTGRSLDGILSRTTGRRTMGTSNWTCFASLLGGRADTHCC